MRHLGCLLLVATAAMGCAGTKTEQIGATQAALQRYGVEPGDTVLLRYANASDPKSSNRSETVRLKIIGSRGVVGVNAGGDVVAATYDELFQLETRQSSVAVPEAVGKAGTGLGKAVFVPLMVACALVAAEAADACLELVGAGD